MDGTPENIPMYPYEISSRLSDLSLLDYSTQPVPESEYSDLDGVERQRLRNIITVTTHLYFIPVKYPNISCNFHIDNIECFYKDRRVYKAKEDNHGVSKTIIGKDPC